MFLMSMFDNIQMTSSPPATPLRPNIRYTEQSQLQLSDILKPSPRDHPLSKQSTNRNRNTTAPTYARSPSFRVNNLSVHPVDNVGPVLPCVACNRETAGGYLTQCEHQVYCVTCAQLLVETSLKEGRLPRCNFIECQAELSFSQQSLYQQFPMQVKTKVQQLIKKRELRNSRATDFPCRIPDCPGLLTKSTHKCNSCKQAHCALCHRVAHSGKCQDGSQIPLEGLQLFECKLCGFKFEKAGGCAKVRCQRPSCRQQICSVCGTEWSFSHHGCQQNGWLNLFGFFLNDHCCCEQSDIDEGEMPIERRTRLTREELQR